MQHTPLDLTVWQHRWQGMNDTMKGWLTAYRQPAHDGQRADLTEYLKHTSATQTSLASLLEGLQAFGSSQLQFFMDGIRPDSSYRLEPSAEYPWSYALSVTLDQIGYDMDVITRAYQQRAAQVGDDDLRQTLAQADKLAYAALKPAIDQKLIDGDATAITYFQKSVHVHLVPYAPVVLVGIPYSAVTSKRDLLMIPHEVGHYVFREGRVRGGRYTGVRLNAAFYNRSKQPPAWLMPWLEEIFADIYGCLLGGPVMALSSQDLAMAGSRADFVDNDDEHPAPALRPDIYLAVLEQMGGNGVAVAKLKVRWEQCLAKRGRPAGFCLADGTHVSLEQARTDMHSVVRVILDDYLPGVWKTERDVWSENLTSGEEAEALYTKFEQKKNSVEKQTPRPPVLAVAGTQGNTEHLHLMHVGEPVRTRKLGNTELWFDAIKGAAQRAAGSEGEAGFLNVPSDVWLVLLTAGGWATEGPSMPNVNS